MEIYSHAFWQKFRESNGWNNVKITFTEIFFRQINSLVISLVKQLFSQNFCQKNVRVNFHNFHTVFCGMVTFDQNTSSSLKLNQANCVLKSLKISAWTIHLYWHPLNKISRIVVLSDQISRMGSFKNMDLWKTFINYSTNSFFWSQLKHQLFRQNWPPSSKISIWFLKQEKMCWILNFRQIAVNESDEKLDFRQIAINESDKNIDFRQIAINESDSFGVENTCLISKHKNGCKIVNFHRNSTNKVLLERKSLKN